MSGRVRAGDRVASYLLERAWVDGAVHDDVLVEIEDGRFTSVTPMSRNSRLGDETSRHQREFHRPGGETVPLPGLTIPGLANCHSHAFHRALRGRTQRERGTFWTWREQMYAVAATLDPDTYFALARATYREMAAAGITAVGEFHYLHHQPDGTPYDDPNAMGHALVEAAREAGIRIALLDTATSAAASASRSRACRCGTPTATPTPGPAGSATCDPLDERTATSSSAPRSTRSARCPRSSWRRSARPRRDRPLHVHLSEQVAENDACLAAYGVTPTRLLARRRRARPADHRGPRHPPDRRRHRGCSATSGTHACFCPTTERDLGDGIGPSRALHDAGAPLTLGCDSHAVIDLFEEMRAVELDERLATRRRGHWTAAELLAAATATGHASLGFATPARSRSGSAPTWSPSTSPRPRTAGTGADENTAVFAAAAEDVTQVMVDGRVVVRQGDRHEIGRELAAAIDGVWSGM